MNFDTRLPGLTLTKDASKGSCTKGNERTIPERPRDAKTASGRVVPGEWTDGVTRTASAGPFEAVLISRPHRLFPDVLHSGMSLGSPSVLEASAAELKLVVGPQGRTIIALAKRFNVRIDLPKGTSTQLTIHGEQAHAALEAIELLLERNLEHQNDNNSTLASASAPSAHSLPLSSLRSPTSYYMKYQLYAI